MQPTNLQFCSVSFSQRMDVSHGFMLISFAYIRQRCMWDPNLGGEFQPTIQILCLAGSVTSISDSALFSLFVLNTMTSVNEGDLNDASWTRFCIQKLKSQDTKFLYFSAQFLDLQIVIGSLQIKFSWVAPNFTYCMLTF